jgi:fatty acid desaturase
MRKIKDNSNKPVSSLIICLIFVSIGVVLIAAGTYLWSPLIVAGIVFILLGSLTLT